MRDSNGDLVGDFEWSPLNVGGLGYVTGIVHASDGSASWCRTDVGGAYRREGTSGKWLQMVSRTSMASSIIENPSPVGGVHFGIWELATAPSDPDILWMFFRNKALRSDDRGISFVDTNLNGTTGLYMNSNGGIQRLIQDKAVVDPSNPEVVYCGSQRDGLWRRLSGVWAQIASVPAATSANGDNERIMIVAVDPTSSPVGSGATSRRSIVYALSNNNGVYRSTDGGDSFALMSGHPGAGISFGSWCMTIDQNGKLYLCLSTGTTNIWTWNGTAWTNITSISNNIRGVAIDPKNASRIVGHVLGSTPVTSVNSGTSWGLYNPTNTRAIATSVPIIASVLETSFRGNGGASLATIKPHPTVEKDFVAMGLGVTYFNSPWAAVATQSLVWVEDAAGIEELVAHNVLITPTGATLLCSHDKAIIRVEADGSFPEASYPASALTNGYAVDYAIDNPDFLVSRVIKGQDYGAYSTNAGRGWNRFAVSPTSRLGGSIAISNTDQIVMVPGQNGHPRYSEDIGASWHLCAFTGITLPTEGLASGFGFGATDTRRQILCADKDTPGTFYIYSYGASGIVAASQGLWKSTDGGKIFNRVNSSLIIPSPYIGYHVVLKCVAGDIYITCGDTGSWFDDNGGATVLKSTNGGVSFATIAGITEAVIAFGKPPLGNTYPAMYLIGWYGGVYGLHRSYDGGATIETIDYTSNFDQPWALAADPTRFGRLVLGFSGTGWEERTYNYTMRLS